MERHILAQRAPDIYLVGTGIVGVMHLTREAEAALAASSHVFLVDPGFGVAKHVESLGPQVHNLLGAYHEGRSRIETYLDMASSVVDAALENPPVSLAVYGNPAFFVYPSTLIRRAAEALDLVVHVVPGISSLDTVLIDLDIDAGQSGLQLYEATALLVENRRLDPEVPCLVLQVDAVESVFHTNAPNASSRFGRLQQHLMSFYPADHLVTNVRSATFPIFGPELTTFPLCELSSRYADHQLGGTLDSAGYSALRRGTHRTGRRP